LFFRREANLARNLHNVIVMAETDAFLLPVPRRAESMWRPSIDIYRRDRGWLIKCELAGVRREDVRITALGRRLSISGVRRDWTIVEGHRVYSMEICYNRFERLVELPCEVEAAQLRVEWRDGMLLVAVLPRD
jgi:HSP20 family protein